MRVSPKNEHSSKMREEGRRKSARPFFSKKFRMHPLFLLVGVWYACKGELFLFFVSTIVALQHELAHAYAAAKLGYSLNSVVLMPFGAVIDGDLRASFKDEIFVALCGPLCNFITALFFGALWWFFPDAYAYTDIAFFSSLSIACINLLPAYPLDGGRILKCGLARALSRKRLDDALAERKAEKICIALSLVFSLLLLSLFTAQCLRKQPNFTLLAFGLFIGVGCFGNRDKNAVYSRMQFSVKNHLKRGVEIRLVALSTACPVKDAFRFLSKGSYLILQIYDEKENFVCNLTQNQLSALFTSAPSPYARLETLLPKIRQK